MKTVYTCFTTDVIHEGHLNIIQEAQKYGAVIVGVLSDEALIRFNRFPTISFSERVALMKGLDGVSQVVTQKDILYDQIIAELHPDYIIHGDNWLDGPMKAIREHVAARLGEYGGQVIDVPYTDNENVRRIDTRVRERLAMPEYRRKRLRQLLELCPIVKTIEVHNGLTGLIAEKTVVENNGEFNQFDAMWISSLCDSTSKGKPDFLAEVFNCILCLLHLCPKKRIFLQPLFILNNHSGNTHTF